MFVDQEFFLPTCSIFNEFWARNSNSFEIQYIQKLPLCIFWSSYNIFPKNNWIAVPNAFSAKFLGRIGKETVKKNVTLKISVRDLTHPANSGILLSDIRCRAPKQYFLICHSKVDAYVESVRPTTLYYSFFLTIRP